MKHLTPSEYFYVSDGRVWKNLEDFIKDVANISDEAFEHHLNKDKNDFYNWISEVFEDKGLARSIQKVKTRSGLLKKLKDHFKEQTEVV